MLLYGTVVKNTREIYAVSVYCGSDTKMSLNSKLSNNKFSSIERSVNLERDSEFYHLLSM